MKIGDIVRLKSGGPEMTIVKISPFETIAICSWFDNSTVRHEPFNITTLEPAKVKTTGIYLIIDRSGSMSGQLFKTIAGYNKFVEEQKGVAGKALMTTVLFDNETATLFSRRDINSVKDLTKEDYVCNGSTALLDAIGETMNQAKADEEALKLDKVIVTILTDGQENASTKFDYNMCKALIETQEARGWDVLFLGANIDVAKESALLGLRSHKVYDMSSQYKSGNLDMMYRAVSRGIGMSRLGTADLDDASRGLECLVQEVQAKATSN